MTHIDYIKTMLNIKDDNVFFYDNRKFLFGIPFYDKKQK